MRMAIFENLAGKLNHCPCDGCHLKNNKLTIDCKKFCFDYERIKATGVSDTQIYKQAGNSIVVKVMEYIFSFFYQMEVKPYEVNTNKH